MTDTIVLEDGHGAAEAAAPEGPSGVDPSGPGSPGRSRRRDILEGPILATLLSLSAPIVAGNLLEAAYEWADMFWVGKLGHDAVASISVSFPASFLIVSVAIGFTIAGTTLVAQYTGADDHEGVNFAAGQTTVLIGASAVVLSLVGHFAAPTLLRLLGTPPEIMADATVYLRVFFWGLGPMFFFFLFQALLRGLGDTVTPMRLTIMTVIMNVVLDPFLIFGWGPFPALGVAGAAYATVISRTVGAGIAVYLISSGRYGLTFTRSSFVPDFTFLRRIIKVGLPSSLETGSRSLEFGVMTWLVSGFGAHALAAYGITGRINSLVLLPSFAISAATTTMVGQNLGAGQDERAAQSGWRAAALIFSVMIFFSAAVLIWPEFFIGIFNDDPEVLAIGSGFLGIVGPAFGFLAAGVVLTGALRGAGDTLPAMVFAFVAGWLFRIPLALLLVNGLDFGLRGLWWAMAASNLLGLILVAVWFRRGSWRKGLLKGKAETAES